MVDAVLARQQGDDFQARMFWMHAVHLLDDASSVRRVLFESGPKAFDDVVVDYDAGGAPQDHRGRPVLRDHLQTKWHVRPGDFGHEDLVDPQFSGGKSVSILERSLDAQRSFAPKGAGARFQLVTNWNARDPLRKLILQQDNTLDLNGIFNATPGSQIGRMRISWAEFLKVDEDELRTLLGTLAINLRIRSGADLRDHLNDKFARFGLVQALASETGFLYDDLIRKLHAQGRKEFDRASFRDLVREEKLIAGPPPSKRTIVGVRSFMHPIDAIEGRTTVNLNLVPRFDGRYLREGEDWNTTIYPELREFVVEAARQGDSIQLVIDVHASLAYAIGAVLDVKSGKSVEIEQRGGGRRFWSATDLPIDAAWPKLVFSESKIGDGAELAIAVGLTHDVEADVRAHIGSTLPGVGRLVVARLENGSSHGAVKCGAHAAATAEQMARTIRSLGRHSLVHLFVAGPNGFMFFLGQQHRSLGTTAVYEFDFENKRGGGYQPALTVD